MNTMRTRISEDGRRAGSTGRRWTNWAAAGGGAIGVAALLVLLAPAAGATTVIGFAAPYTAFTASTYHSTSTYGCGSAHFIGSPSWSNTTGTFSADARASMTNCTGYNGAYAEADTYLTSPTFSFARGGNAYITTKITAAWQARATLSGTTSSGSFDTSYAESYATATVYLYDLTTGGIIGGSGSTFVLTIVSLVASTAGSSISASTSTVFSVFAYGTVHATHTYEFIVGFDAYAYVSSDSGASGSAMLNLGGTNGVTLSSITVA